uniref:DSPn domain-containing protein n=1 Tax=Ascaris lumbricoides TaxID=6252 RepID=A0A0M3IVJ4_ASCLU
LGEEYWSIVNKDGSLRDGRTTADFLTFDATHNRAPIQNAYVAFLITYDAQGHYETFGQAYIDYGSVCARFVDRYGRNLKLCGGFRVLSRKADHSENRNPLVDFYYILFDLSLLSFSIWKLFQVKLYVFCKCFIFINDSRKVSRRNTTKL